MWGRAGRAEDADTFLFCCCVTIQTADNHDMCSGTYDSCGLLFPKSPGECADNPTRYIHLLETLASQKLLATAANLSKAKHGQGPMPEFPKYVT